MSPITCTAQNKKDSAIEERFAGDILAILESSSDDKPGEGRADMGVFMMVFLLIVSRLVSGFGHPLSKGVHLTVLLSTLFGFGNFVIPKRNSSSANVNLTILSLFLLFMGAIKTGGLRHMMSNP